MPVNSGGHSLLAAALLATSLAAIAITTKPAPGVAPPELAASPSTGEPRVESGIPAVAISVIGRENPVHSFYFTRGAYTGWGQSWAMDAPAADRWIASVMGRLTLIDISPEENFVALDDPDLGRFPFLYLLEVGRMQMRDSEVQGLRNYLLRGGFVMVDDFWGTNEWYNWEYQMRRVLPEYEIVELPLTHELFSTMYNVDEIVQVPGVGNVQRGRTYEQDGVVPHVRGIFDDDGRLMMVINWNTDLGDAWEWAEASYYPLHYSTYAYQVAANTFMYALTH
jgi:hypothetical protein